MKCDHVDFCYQCGRKIENLKLHIARLENKETLTVSTLLKENAKLHKRLTDLELEFKNYKSEECDKD